MANVPVTREFWNDMLKRVIRRTRGSAEAEDLLHAAYLALEKYRTQQNIKSLPAFLLDVAAKISIDNYRSSSIRNERPVDLASNVTSGEPLQDEVMAARAKLERVKDGLSKLTPRTRTVFLMHRLDNLKYHEIAYRLGISESAVEKHIAKAALFLHQWTKGW